MNQRSDSAGDRWAPRAPAPSADSADPGPEPGTAAGDALTAAAQRVLEDTDAWRDTALDPAEADRQLRHLCEILAAGDIEALERGERAGEIMLQRKLLDLLRRELLLHRTSADDAELVTMLARIETVQSRLEPDRHQSTATALMGVSSRDLVVELAHDLRSPLTSIMFLAETLRKGQSGPINDVQRQQVGIIYSASLSLASVASDLIDMAREGEFVTAPLEPEPFSLTELFDSVQSMIAPMAHEKRLYLQFYTPDRDARMGSAARLSRVILNLASNAIKFTENGRIEIVAVERGLDRVEFSVSDTGRGMDEKTLATLYEPFQRGESGTGFHFSGTGLGLSICRRLVDIMGGELQVESRPGQGTRFCFELAMPRVRRE